MVNSGAIEFGANLCFVQGKFVFVTRADKRRGRRGRNKRAKLAIRKEPICRNHGLSFPSAAQLLLAHIVFQINLVGEHSKLELRLVGSEANGLFR